MLIALTTLVLLQAEPTLEPAPAVESEVASSSPGTYSGAAAVGGTSLAALAFGVFVAPLAIGAASGGSYSITHWGNTQTRDQLWATTAAVAMTGVLTMPLLAWTLHRNAGGKGSLGGAYLGLGAGVAVAGALLALLVPVMEMTDRGGNEELRMGGIFGLPILAIGALIAGPALGLHFSHSQAVPSISLGPTKGGAAVSLGWTF